MNRKLSAAALALAAVVGICAVPAATAAGSIEKSANPLAGKHILLTNDDSVQAARANGADGRGLYLVRRALCHAGADVVVVGPWAQQSGRSQAASGSPTVTVAPPMSAPGEFAADCATAPGRGLVLGVCQGVAPCSAKSASATPADTVALAVGSLLVDRAGWADGPDLVVSGINSGANTDLSISLSGTVGAAASAVERGVPAIAVSGGTRATSVPSDATYSAAADYVTGLAKRLFATRTASQLVREHVLLNVNCPDVAPGVSLRPQWTNVGRIALDQFSYQKDGVDSYQMGFGPVQPTPRPMADTDTKALLEGRISVGAVSVDRGRPGYPAWAGSLLGSR